MSEYDEKAARSPMTDDMRRLLRVNAKLAEMFAGADFFVMDAEITIGSPDGYVIGSVWWDGESEVWRLDTKRHGDPI